MLRDQYNNPYLSLLNSTATPQSDYQKDELNDSIDLYLDSKVSPIEAGIVKYLHGLGVQTKTDPGVKEQLYWNSRRREGNYKLEQCMSLSTLPLNSTLTRLLAKRQA